MSSREIQIPILKQEIAIGRYIFYPNIVVGELNEGVHATYESSKKIVEVVEEIYGKENNFIEVSR